MTIREFREYLQAEIDNCDKHREEAKHGYDAENYEYWTGKSVGLVNALWKFTREVEGNNG